MSILVVSEFPKASEMNSVLYDKVCENILDENKEREKVALGGRRTDWNLHEQKIEEIDVLISWIKNILPEVNKNFAVKAYNEESQFNYNLNSFEIAECWGVHYNKGESLVEHCHFPYALSFIYYVRTPKGSALIMIGGEPHNVKEGQCIFFLASQYHSVGRNDCDGRCAIIGNILYRF